MLKSDKRFVKHLYFKPSVGRRKDVIPPQPMSYIEALHKAFVDGNTGLPDDAEDNRPVMILTDAKVDETDCIAYFVFVFGDPHEARQVYLDVKNGNTRPVRKEDDELAAVSGHVAIACDGQEDDPGALFLLEYVPSITRSAVQHHMKQWVNGVKDELPCVEKETDAIVHHKAFFKILALPNQKTKDALSGGKLLSIDVVKKKQVASKVDAHTAYVHQHTTQHFKPEPESTTGQKALAVMKSVFTKAKDEGMNSVKIHYTDKNDQTHTIPIETQVNEEVEEILTGKMSQVDGFKDELLQCNSSLNPEMIAKMRKLIDEHRAEL